MKWAKSADCFAGLPLFFSSLLFFYDLYGGRYLLTERDLGPYFIPPRFFWVESIKNGDFPLWNPYQFTGYPFFANPQYAILYPFNGLFFLLPFDIAFNAIILLHFFLGGLFTYLFLRDLEADLTASLISGSIFMLSGYLLSVHSLLTCLLSVIWTPLILMFFRRALVHPGFKNEILTAIFVTLSFLGGGIEIVYGNFFVLLFMAIFPIKMGDCRESPLHNTPPSPPFIKGGLGGLGEPLCGLTKRAAPEGRHYRNIINRFRSLLIVSILFLFLSAIQLIPFLELYLHSIRGQGISYQEATIWSFAPKDILLFFLPDAYGYFLDMKKYWVNQCWFKTLYTGGLPFLLSAIFFIFGRHVGEPLCGLTKRAAPEGRPSRIYFFGDDRGFYLSLMLLSLFLSLGQYNPLYPFVFKYVPFFNGIRYPVKFLYIFILVISIAAGLGFQRLTELSKESRKRGFKNLLILFSFASGLLLLFLVLNHKGVESFLKLRGIDFPDFNHLSANLYHAKRFLFYLTLFFLFLRIGVETKWRGWIKILLIIFLIGDLFGNMGFYGKEKTSDYFQKTRTQEIVFSDQGNFRIFSTGKTIALDTPIFTTDTSALNVLKQKHPPSMNLLHRLRDIWGIDVVRLKRVDDLYKAFIGAPSISATHLVDLYGVKYVVSVTPIEGDPRFELIYAMLEGLPGKKKDLLKENTIKLYRNRLSPPRVWLVKRYRVLDSNEILSTIGRNDFHPGKVVLLEEEPRWEKKAIGGRRGPPLQRTNDVGEPLRGLPHNVELISESNNQLILHVNAKENKLLVLSDTYFPGWKAYVHPMKQGSQKAGGLEKKILRANYNFRAIPLEAGEYEIRFIYNPISFKIGSLLSLITLVAIVFYFIRWPQRATTTNKYK